MSYAYKKKKIEKERNVFVLPAMAKVLHNSHKQAFIDDIIRCGFFPHFKSVNS